MRGDTYQLILRFAGRRAQTLLLAAEARELLRKRCEFGEVKDGLPGRETADLRLVTKKPWECLNDCVRRLKSIKAKPVAAAYRRLNRDRSGRLRPVGREIPFQVG